MSGKNKNQISSWVLWLIVWLLLFSIFTYTFLGPVQQSFVGELVTPVGSAQITVEDESEKIILSVVYGFFASVIAMIIAWAIIQVYKIKLRKKIKR